MENVVIAIHIIIALAIIGLILLQQGKGAEAGASFGGGASQTVFGSQGGGNFFAKVTAVLAVIFFTTSFLLAIFAKNKAEIPTNDIGMPTTSEQTIVEEQIESDVPSVGGSIENIGSSDVPVINDSGNPADINSNTDDSDVPDASTNEVNQTQQQP